jgi:hypothetical protein
MRVVMLKPKKTILVSQAEPIVSYRTVHNEDPRKQSVHGHNHLYSCLHASCWDLPPISGFVVLLRIRPDDAFGLNIEFTT